MLYINKMLRFKCLQECSYSVASGLKLNVESIIDTVQEFLMFFGRPMSR
jgi:hypothetical protein